MNFQRILVFRTGHLGDTLVSLPSFWAVRNAFPNARIALLSNIDKRNPNYISPRDVLPESGLFDEWIDYPTNVDKFGKLAGYARLWHRLRKEKFDACFYLMTRNREPASIDRDIIFFRRSGIRQIIGTKYLRENFISFNSPTPVREVESEGEFLLRCLEYENFPVNRQNLRHELLLAPDEIAFGENWIKDNVGQEDFSRPLIAIGPGSKWESKIWAEEKFADVISRLITKEGVLPIIFGGPEDSEKGNRLIAKWNCGINAAGELKIRETAAVLKKCSLYLGNDTGTMHLAAVVGIRCVAIFAATDFPGRWYPFGEGHHIFRKEVECQTCYTPNCFNQHKCLELVEKDKVYAACLNVLHE